MKRIPGLNWQRGLDAGRGGSRMSRQAMERQEEIEKLRQENAALLRQLDQRNDEISRTTMQVLDLEGEIEAAQEERRELRAENAALRARVEALECVTLPITPFGPVLFPQRSRELSAEEIAEILTVGLTGQEGSTE